jgi:hypothetical protein
VVVIVVIFIACWFLTGFYLFFSLFEFLGVGCTLMIAQKILFAVRVIGCLVCDISGVSVECENISYALIAR